jgi:hypothetical protein
MSFPLPVFSTSRDLLVTSVFRRHTHLAVNLLSIRSTGCAARVLILAEHGHSFEPKFLILCRTLEVEIEYFEARGRYHTDFFRMRWLLSWLTDHVKEVNRIFYFDAFDVFFQRDPFDRLVDPGRMTFISEGVLIRKHQWNWDWIRNCIGEKEVLAVQNNEIICSGTVAGDGDVFLRYLRLLASNETLWTSCVVDQPQINFLVWTGKLDEAGIPWKVLGCAGNVNSMYYCPKHRIYFEDGMFDISENEVNMTSPAVHHYKAWRGVVNNFYRRCGVKR